MRTTQAQQPLKTAVALDPSTQRLLFPSPEELALVNVTRSEAARRLAFAYSKLPSITRALFEMRASGKDEKEIASRLKLRAKNRAVLAAVIVGKALYKGNFTLKEAIKAAK